MAGAGPEFKDEYGLFLDQLISALKSLVENAQMPPDEALSIDLGSILHILVGFISRFNDPVSHRIRVKFCALCDSICHRTDMLTLRKDDLSRNRIIDIVMDWFRDPTSNTDPEAVQFQYELNFASLRTVVKLLERLKLQPIDNNSNDSDDSRHVVSRLFIRYSHGLLRALDICQSDPIVPDSTSDVPSLQKKMQASQREADIRDLVIIGLSHLVTSNSENAVKHCIASAYDGDTRKRTIFVNVFARVLGQGTKFEAQGNPELQARRDQLRERVKGFDMVLAMVICECCPANEVDMMISVLMNIFDTRASLVALLKTMIDREIAHTSSEVDLFRGNSTCMRFLSAFARIHGYNYLRGLIVPLIKTMTSMPAGHAYDLDPAKANRDKLEQNKRNVELVALSFLDIITSSVPALPPMIREVCAHLAKSVYQVWPESKFAALGAFIFLRFISPAIVAPEIVGVLVPRDDGGVIRRGLMVIAKVMQNLANNILFAKEAHMLCLNEFLGVNIKGITRYLSEVNKFSSTAIDEESTEWLGTTADDTDTIVLHRFLDKHADKIGKKLLSYAKLNASGEEDASTANAKSAWEHLCNLLVKLQEVHEVPHFSKLPRTEHREFIDLMNCCAHRSIESVQDIFVAADVPLDLPAVFVLRVCQIDVEALDIELLMYHSLKTLLSPAYEDRKFEVVLDCTSFTSTSEIPAQWLTTCSQLISIDIRRRFLTSYILNPNSLTQKLFTKSIFEMDQWAQGGWYPGHDDSWSSNHLQPPQLSPPLDTNIQATDADPLASGLAASTAPHMYQGFSSREPAGARQLPNSCTSLEEEGITGYTEVTMRQAHEMRMPVTMEVADTHVRVTSIRAAVISPNLNCKSTEIISLADVSDAYNVSTGLDPYEFIIRISKQGVTSYLSSPQRDNIVKSIRAAKSQLRDTRYLRMDRFPRFSNISATLLHVGMLNIDSEDEGLRGAAYDLLGALCSYLNYDKNPIIVSKAGIIPGEISTFVIGLSDRLAGFALKLTLDFISVISAGMDKATAAQRITCLQYMSPWVKNLAKFCNPTSSLYEHSGARLRDCIRSLIDLTISDLEINSMIHRHIWVEISHQDSTLVYIVLEELIRAASDGGIGSRRCETIARSTAALSSINVRGRMFPKLRKALGKTSLKPSKTLPENVHWNEIANLARFALVASNHSKHAAYDQLYIPDIFHIVTLIALIYKLHIRGIAFRHPYVWTWNAYHDNQSECALRSLKTFANFWHHHLGLAPAAFAFLCRHLSSLSLFRSRSRSLFFSFSLALSLALSIVLSIALSFTLSLSIALSFSLAVTIFSRLHDPDGALVASCSQIRVGALVFWLMLKGALAVSRSQSRMISSTTGTRLTGHHVTIRTPTPTIRAGIGAYPNTTTTNDHHAASNATSTMRKRPTHASKC
ncbi:hypothetical protein C8R48DRAFT_830907 [Suillus tomentosus]|nr:hypothetical protein C8R48DRAFT_830907 [Suillus tomentosus]